MAPVNLENNIREKLESRELKPSSDAWKKFEATLDKKQPKSKKILWYYVAASFVGLMILSSILFNQNSLEENRNFVDSDQKQINIENAPEISSEVSHKEEVATEDIFQKIPQENKNTDNKINPIPPKKESSIDKQIQRSEVIAEASPNKTEPTNKVVSSKEGDELIEKKVHEVAASIKSLQNNNSEVTVEEVETLLNNARRDIQTQRILQSPKIDAMALLEEVEWELDKSFRDKVFDALGEGFQKIRFAISERNN